VENVKNKENKENTDIPLHEREIIRDIDTSKAELEVEFQVEEIKNFRGYFPNMSIRGSKIHELFFYPDDKYEKIMGLCLYLTVAAVFNPFLLMIFYYINRDFSRLAFVFFLLTFFFCSVMTVKKSFWIPGMMIVVLLKAFYFWDGTIDALFAAVMFSTAYLMFCFKKSKGAV